jgi:F5/8 type C domain
MPQSSPPPATMTPANQAITQATAQSIIQISTRTAVPGSTETLVTTPRPTSLPKVSTHRIAIHSIYGLAEFYNRETSKQFIPRGVNYSLLVPIAGHYEDRLFGVGLYDHNRTMADFSALAAGGYNTVRIILDGCTSGDGCIGVQDGQGLNPAYLDNIVDLMNLARDANLFLILAINDPPELGGYAALANQGVSENFAAGRNTELLTKPGIQAARSYWSDLLAGLAARNAPFEIVLAWEQLAEQYYLSDHAPFSLTSGKVTPANGKTYDLTKPFQKQALAEDGVRYYIDQVRQAILAYDSSALITMGFFAPDSPYPWREGDNRYVETAGLLIDSDLDFYDLHAYPGAGLSMAEIAQNFGLTSRVNKPVMMGEVGAYTWTYPDIPQAAIAVQDWIAASCPYRFSSWLYQAYYPSPAGLLDATWGFVDEQNYILNALSPVHQPDACFTTVLPGRNLALNKPVTVSAALPDQSPQNAVDGDPNTQWSAGAFPEQWIEVDLGSPVSIGEIRLTVGQWPAGYTVHQVWVGAAQDAMRQVHEFSGSEYDFDILSYIPAAPLQDIRYVRIVTSDSPSWVAWREIEVLAPFPATPTPSPSPEITPTP